MSKNLDEQRIEDFLLQSNFIFKSLIELKKEVLPDSANTPRFPILILTCMDSRIDVNKIFQFNIGDAIILRNAGNTFSLDVLRGLLVAIHEFNVRKIIVLGHLDCGMTKIDINSLYNHYYNKRFPTLGVVGKDSLKKDFAKFFKTFESETDNIKSQVRILEIHPLIPENVNITGMLYDLYSGFVFDFNDVKTLSNASDFELSYKSILSSKIKKYENFIYPPNLLEEEAKPRPEEEEETKFEEKEKEVILLKKTSNIIKPHIPSLNIKVPKIKIYLPKIYKKVKDEDS